MLESRIGQPVGIERIDVKALPIVLHRGNKVGAFEAQVDLDVVRRAAVADGVGAGLLDCQHDVTGNRRVLAVDVT